MGKWLGIAMAFVMVLTLSACSQPEPTADDTAVEPAPTEVPEATEPAVAEPADAPMEETAAPEVTPAEPAPADPAATPPAVDGAAAPADAAASDSAAGLVGTKWKYDAYTAEFSANNVLKVSVGEMTMDGEYKVADDGSVEISAMGTTLNGSWDGTTLTIDGNALEKAE